MPPPPPGYPAPKPPPREPSSAEFLKVKSNLRHVESNTSKKKVRAEDRLLSDHRDSDVFFTFDSHTLLCVFVDQLLDLQFGEHFAQPTMFTTSKLPSLIF